ncbi:MAG: LTA synthase family protein [Acholeplasmataceae bacterium]|jgi:lipoteichoic acid synthase
MSVKRKLNIFTALFIILSMIGTYFVTTEGLNNFLISFTITPFTVFSSIIGNLLVLIFIVAIVFLVFKKAYTRMRVLTVISFILSFFTYLIFINIRYYQAPFLIKDLTFAKHAGPDITFSIMTVAITDLFTQYRVILFLGFFVLLILYFVFSHDRQEGIYSKKVNPKVSLQSNKILLATILGSLLLSFGHVNLSYRYTRERWQLNHERPLYGLQVSGLYNFYLYDFLGFEWADENIVSDETLTKFESYDKNKNTYVNFFGETYGNQLLLSDATTVTLSDKLGEVTTLNGLFANKNIIYIQLESLNTFLVDGSSPYLESLNMLPYFKTLINESYFFDNFYSTVGIGNSSDAEISGMTGFYTQGNNLMYWQYGSETYPREITLYDKVSNNAYKEMINYELNPLPEALGSDYFSASFHADGRQFYNRENTHPGMLKIDEFYHFTEYELPDKIGNYNAVDYFPNFLEKNPGSPWVSEKDLFEWVKMVAKEKSMEHQKYFLYPITIHPHTPYLYDPYADDPALTKADLNVSQVTLDCLNYLRFYNEVFKEILDMAKELENTIYVIYADHGTGFSPNDMRVILDKPHLTELEIWEELYKVPALIYAPDDTSDGEIKSGLIKGRQPLVRSQIDLYRTVLELVGRNDSHYYYGVNALSNEKTFAFQTRVSLLMTDDFTLQLKKYSKNDIFSRDYIYLHNDDMDYDFNEIIDKVLEFKETSDRVITNNLVQEVNRKKKGQD